MTRRSRHRVRVWPWLRRPGSLVLRDWLAITIGRDILAWRPLSDGELRHELAHVEQWRRHGWTLPLRYALASWRAWRGRTGWYDGNTFEIEARAAERTARVSAQDDAHA